MQGLANKVIDGNCEMLANSMNDFVVSHSVSEHLPRLNEVFEVEGELPDKRKPKKASLPDNTPAWVLKEHADLLAPPLTAIFNCLLREGKLPNEWKIPNYHSIAKSIYNNYMDDSTLFEICEMNSISLMQESVNVAAEWTNNNDMKINSEKSKEMLTSYARGKHW